MHAHSWGPLRPTPFAWLARLNSRATCQRLIAVSASILAARQAGLGLFWLIVAKDSASADESWITDTYGAAFAQATDEERALAYKYLENWVKRRANPVPAPRD